MLTNLSQVLNTCAQMHYYMIEQGAEDVVTLLPSLVLQPVGMTLVGCFLLCMGLYEDSFGRGMPTGRQGGGMPTPHRPGPLHEHQS